MCVRSMEASVFQGLPVEFPVGVATRTRAFYDIMLVTSTIDINENAY